MLNGKGGARVRTDKYVGDSTNYSRKEIRKLAKDGQIRVNGTLVTDPSTYVDPENDTVTVCGEKINYRKYVYLMMYKPAGVLTATEDSHGKETFADYIREDYAFYNVTAAGRLDIDAEGFLLLTNDGAFVHDIITPNRHVEKRYFCKIAGNLCRDACKMFETGIKLDDGYVCMPAKIEISETQTEDAQTGETLTEAVVTVCEGHFHQVKRMVAACGGKVVFLKRISIGGVELDTSLKPGEYRELTEDEFERLKRKGSN